MANLFAGLLILISGILQVTLASRLTLLQGPADVVLLVLIALILQDGIKIDWRWSLFAGLILSLSSFLPIWVILSSYASASALTHFLSVRFWQNSILVLFTSVLLGSLLVDAITMLYLWINATPMNLSDALNFIVLPRLIFNMLLALPVYAVVGELGKLLIPEESVQ